jgi:hypothetical protein
MRREPWRAWVGMPLAPRSACRIRERREGSLRREDERFTGKGVSPGRQKCLEEL